MAELIQHISQKRFINKFEAEAMLAGIMVDSNNFSGRTGVRTFEAASWLKRAGADTTEVKRFFQMSADDLRKKGQAIAGAEITDSGFAFARTEGGSDNSQIVNAQVADELLMFKGVTASFVLCTNEDGDTIVSARSLGDFNVQAIMEKLGGGGHFTSAAAKTEKSKDETEEEIKKLVRENLDKELFSDDDSKIEAMTRRDTLF
jgi:c-di-AMP phosphodiesterase-like protein